MIDLIYCFLYIITGGFVFFVFQSLVKRKSPYSGYLLPLAAYLILWQSWSPVRVNLLPEFVWESEFWYSLYFCAHEGMLMLLIGVALIPLLLDNRSNVENLELPAASPEYGYEGFQENTY